MNTRRFTLAQREPGKSNLDQQRLATDRPTRHHPYLFAFHKPKLTESPGNRVVGVPVLHVLHQSTALQRQI